MSANTVLDELAFDADSGALVYKEVRYLLIRPETLIAFQKAAEARLFFLQDLEIRSPAFKGS